MKARRIAMLGAAALAAGIVVYFLAVHVMASITIASVSDAIGARYGDDRPIVARVIATTTESPPHAAMFLVRIDGTFRCGGGVIHTLGFSVTADGSPVWALTALNRQGQAVSCAPRGSP